MLVVCAAPNLRAQTILSWDFTGESGGATSTAEVQNANLDSSNLLTRGATAAASSASNTFRTVGFKNEGISTANTDYFQFEASAATGNTLSLSTIDYKFAGTATYSASPGASMQFAYSLDATNFTLIGSPFVTTAASGTGTQISLSGIGALQSLAASTIVTFRFYATGQTTTGGWGFNSPSAGAGLALGGTFAAAGGANVSRGGTATFTSSSFGGNTFTSADTAVFDGTATTVNLSGAVLTSGLKFTTTAYTLASPTGSDTVSVTGGNVDVASGVTATISGQITGSNILNKTSTGTLVLSGANDFVGNVSITAGTLSISSDANLGNTANDIALGGTLATTASISLNAGRDISGSGTLDIANGTTLTVNGAFGVGALTLANTGSLALAGSTNALTGLTFNAAAAMSGNALALSGDVSTSGFGGTATVSNNLALGTAARTYTTAATDTLVLSGNLASTSAGRIQKRGSGTLTLSGDNSGLVGVQLGSQGASPLEGGTLIVGSDTALGASVNQFQFNSGTLTSSSARTFANGISVGGRTAAVTVPKLAGANMEFQGSPSFYRAAGTSGELRLDVNNVTTLSGNALATTGTGLATGITLGGSGTLILTGENHLLTDNLTVSNTLTVQANSSTALGTGAVTISGGTLTSSVASLSLGGNFTILSGSVSPNQTSAGAFALAVDKNFVMSGGTLNLTLGASFDQITGSGAGTFSFTGGTLALDTTGAGFGYGSTYQIFSGFASGSVSGVSFSGFDSADFAANLSNSGTLSFSAVPEPSTYAAILGTAVLASAVWKKRRKRQPVA